VKAVNLIPSEQRAGGGPAAGQSEGAAFMVLGLLAGLAVLAGLYGIASHEVSSRKEKVASVNAQAQITQARASALAPYTSFKAMYEQRLSAVTELVNTRFDWAHAFHELGRVLPADVSLTSVKGTIGAAGGATGAPATPAAPAAPATAGKGTSTASTGASTASSGTSTASASAVTSATPPGSVPTFVLAGCATSQAEVAQTIQRLRLIDGVGVVTLQSSTKSTSGGGGSSGSGGCPAHDPSFAMTVTFAGLPTPAASSAAPSGSATSTAAATGTGAASPSATPAASPGGSQ
jgi:hypothetical protein